MPASISSKTSVSPPATAAIASAIRDSSPPDAVSATGANGKAGVRADSEDGVVGAGRARLVALAELAPKLAVAHADVAELGCDGVGERGRGGVAFCAQFEDELVDALLGGGELAPRGFGRVDAVLERGELGACLGGAREQLLVRLAAEAALRLGDPVELGLELLESAGLGLEGSEESAKVRRRFAQAKLDVPQLVAGGLELGRDLLERRDCSLGETDEAARSLAVVRRERGRRRLGGGCEVGDVTDPLAVGAETLLVGRLHPFGVLDKRPKLGEPRLCERGVRGQLVVAAPRRLEVAPRPTRRGTARELLVATETVEHLELVRRPREAPLLELPRHRDHALDRRGDVLACGGSPPRVRARAPVREDAAGDDERFLVFGPQLAERLELCGKIELGLDVRLLAGGTDEALAAFRAEQQAERLGEDRLPRPRLARDRVQAGRELEFGLADEDEVLDPKAPQHPSDGTPGTRRRPLSDPDTSSDEQRAPGEPLELGGDVFQRHVHVCLVDLNLRHPPRV